MEMAAAALPGTIGANLAHSHSCSEDHSKPVFQVSLPLRLPAKPHIATNHDKFQTVATNPNSHNHKIAKEKNKLCTASDVLHLMDALSLPVPTDMYASLVKECTETANSSEADELHAHIARIGLQFASVSLLNRLLLMHVSHGRVDCARELFDRMSRKDFKSWAVMVVAYANGDDYQEGMSLFLRMLRCVSMVEFPAWVMVCVLRMCVCTRNVGFGKQVHACSLKLGHANNLFLASCLINFYGKFRCLESANVVFNQLPCHGAPTWMARLINNSREQRFFEVFRDFKEIGEAGIKKNAFMFSSVLKACARMHDNGRSGRQVHANAVKLGFESDEYVQCGLVDMYGRSGLVEDAKRAFHINGDGRNNACWNAMLRGYIRNEFYLEAIKFIYEMKAAGVQLQQSLLVELRIACGSNSLGKLHWTNGTMVF